MSIEFFKYHGLGNDFLLLYEQEVDSNLARSLCDRHEGVGADGVIQIRKSDHVDFDIFVYNADGSLAEVSGNGLRCVGKFLYDREIHRDSILRIEAGGEVKVLELTLSDGKVASVRADMGIGIDQGDVELFGRKWKKISTGNPHAVTFVEDIDSAPVADLGPMVEHHPEFPNRTNVEFVMPEGDLLHVRFWERGVGITLASGTGACAAAVAAGLRRCTVRTLGGDLTIERDEEDRLHMTGPATFVFEGRMP